MKPKHFKHIYKSLNEQQKKEVAIVVNKKKYTWEAVKLEADNKTRLGKKLTRKIGRAIKKDYGVN